MNQNQRHIGYLTVLILGMSNLLHCYDNAHFYRATNFLYEPRIEREYLSTIDVTLNKGSTKKARNKNHDTVPLLDIYGLSNMHELGIGVPKDLSNPCDLILTQLSLVPSRCSDATCCTCSAPQEFGTFSFSGRFDIFETVISFIQNFTRGFYLQLYIPFRKMKIKDICFCDNSPQDSICPNINSPIWEIFKANFEKILAKYDLCINSFSETGAGDVSVLLGWSHSFQNMEALDFIDLDILLGVLAPSGMQRDPDQVFSLPLGYDGHVGAIIGTEFAFGLFDWLNIGSYFNTIVFGSKTKCARIKTGLQQSGFIKLAKTEVKIEKGTIWQVGAYLKFDHFVRGLSFIFAYSFANQNRDELTPCDPEKFPPSIVNSDQMLQGWKMHTVNFILEYDFATRDTQFAPRIGVQYNLPVGGKRIFLTDTGGGFLGLDVSWDF